MVPKIVYPFPSSSLPYHSAGTSCIDFWQEGRSDRGREHLCIFFLTASAAEGLLIIITGMNTCALCVCLWCVHIDCSWNCVLNCRSVADIRSHSPVYSRSQSKRGAHKCCFFSSGETHEESERKNSSITSEWENKITKHSVWLTCQTNLSALTQAALCALILSTHEYTSSMMADVWFFSSLLFLSQPNGSRLVTLCLIIFVQHRKTPQNSWRRRAVLCSWTYARTQIRRLSGVFYLLQKSKTSSTQHKRTYRAIM